MMGVVLFSTTRGDILEATHIERGRRNANQVETIDNSSVVVALVRFDKDRETCHLLIENKIQSQRRRVGRKIGRLELEGLNGMGFFGASKIEMRVIDKDLNSFGGGGWRLRRNDLDGMDLAFC